MGEEGGFPVGACGWITANFWYAWGTLRMDHCESLVCMHEICKQGFLTPGLGV